MFPKTLFGFYWSVVKKFPIYFVGGFLLIMLTYLVDNITFPYTNKWSVDIFEAALNGDWSVKIYWIATIYALIFLLNWIGAYVEGHWAPLVNRYTGFVLYRRVFCNDTDFFVNCPSGQILTNISIVGKNLDAMMLGFYANLVKYLIGILIVSSALFAMNWRIAVVICVVAVARAGWRFITQRPINRAVKERQSVDSAINGMRTDSLANAMTVKLFGNVDYETKYVWRRQEQQIKLAQKVSFLRLVQSRPSSFLWFAMMLVVMLMSAKFVMDGGMGVSDAVFAFVGTRTISNAFIGLTDILTKYSENKAAATRAFGEIIQPCNISDATGAKKIKRGAVDSIDFENVSFNYGKNDVVKNFNLHIGKNEKIGIVGLSGAGKTTLVNLLLRVYDVNSGAIKINGDDIRDLSQDSLYKNIAVVPQDAILFNRSLMDNIRYARPTASKADVISAAKCAHIHDFITGLPDGYDTLVGNRGIKLSGGQRQRIAIARAVLKNAPILVLDEATSALDSKNEVQIQAALKKAMTGKTTIAVAHRLSTLRDMDRIIVLKKGKIIESGTHSKLLRIGGLYRKLWDMQTGGFME